MSPRECSDPGEGGWEIWILASSGLRGRQSDQEHLGRAHRCRLVLEEKVLDRQSETDFKPQKHRFSAARKPWLP